MGSKVKVEMNPNAEKLLADMFRRSVREDGIEIECQGCGERFTMSGDSTRCPRCGLEHHLA